MKEYLIAQHKGREWGVFHAPTRNWCIFGSKKAMQERVKELNDGR